MEIEQLLNDQEDSNLAQDNSDQTSNDSKLKSLNFDKKSRNSENIIPEQDEGTPVLKNDCDLIFEKLSLPPIGLRSV